MAQPLQLLADIGGMMRWHFETGEADGLVVVHEDDLKKFSGLAPEMVLVVDSETSKLIAYWHLEDQRFLREAFVGQA